MRFSLILSLLTTLAICTPLIARENTSVPVHAQKANTATIGYRMVRVRDTRILFPRLTRYPNKTVLTAVNRQIDDLTKDFGCEPGSTKNYFEVKSRVEYADKAVFSIYASASYYCGTAYPTNDANMSLTFDLRTGEKIRFEQLFKDYEADKREILRTIFAKQVERANKLAAAAKQGSDNCEEDAQLFSLEHLKDSSYSYNFTRSGLAVQPSWPHVIEACAERVIVPYAEFRKFAAPGGILFRVMR